MQTLRGTTLAVGLATIIIGVLVLADYGAQYQCSLAFGMESISCLLRAHEDIAGGLIGGAGTIFAAWLAWVAIQRQIIASRWYETELRKTLIEEISPFVDLLDRMRVAIDLALEPNQTHEQSRVTTFRTALAWSNPPDDYFDNLEKLGSGLAPLDKNRFQKLMERIKLFIQRIVSFREDGQPAHDLNWHKYELGLAKIQLTVLKLDLDQFDRELGRKLSTSTVEVDRDTWAEQFTQQMDLWLKEEKLRAREEG
jgi:hypothetical protein